ncbi:MAG: DUF4065 domain-containing protein [Desulfovibrionaceae bacterium]|nr:DUF4065 domain-containing protein [Desulfovibrionaceae bacterium]
MTTIKLQKLVYYCQAWAMVWTDKPLFAEDCEAWANGPVIPALYKAHKGLYQVDASAKLGDSQKLTDDERDSIDVVLREYGDKSSQWLVESTHLENPWRDARCGVPVGVRSQNVIPKCSIAEYYSGLLK